MIRSIFIILALVTDLITVLIALRGGWEVLMFGLLFLGIWITHLVVHIKFASRISRWTAGSAAAFICSDLVLLGAFLAQRGQGDGPAWVYITPLLNQGQYVPHWYSPQLGLSTFVLVFLSWICIRMLSRPRRDWFPKAAIITNALSGLVIAGLLFTVFQEAKQNRETKFAKETALEVALIEAFGGLPPTNCEAGPIPLMPADNPLNFAPNYNPPVGVAPVWWAGPQIEKGRAVIHFRYGTQAFNLRSKGLIVPQNRIEVLVGWYVEGIEGIPVNVQVTSEPSGETIPLMIGRSGRERKDGILDPADASIIKSYGGHRSFGGRFFVPGAGCYAMEARWPGGSWRIPFAVGW